MKNILGSQTQLLLFGALIICLPVIPNLSTLLSVILFILALANGTYKSAFSGSNQRITFLSIAYFLWLSGVSILNSPRRDYFEDMSVMFGFIILPVVVFSCASRMQNLNHDRVKNWALFLTIMLLSLAILQNIFITEPVYYAPFGTDGQFRYWYIGFRNAERVGLLTGNPLTFADISFPIVFASFFYFWRFSSRRKIVQLFIFATAAYVLIILTGNRSAFIGYIVMTAIVIAYLFLAAEQNSQRRFVVYVLLFVVFLIVVGFLYGHQISYYQRFNRIFDALIELSQSRDIQNVADRSIRIRLDFYQSAIQAWLNRPFTGYGAGNQMEAVRPYFLTDATREATHLKTVHSFILNNLITGGLIGFLMIFGLVCSPIYRVVMNWNRGLGLNWLYLAASITVPVLVLGLTNNIFYDDSKTTAFLTYIFLFWATTARDIHLPNHENRIHSSPT